MNYTLSDMNDESCEASGYFTSFKRETCNILKLVVAF